MTRRRLLFASLVLGVVLLTVPLFGQERTMSAIFNAVYDPARQALMGIRWAEAQSTVERTAQAILNAVFVEATETSNAHLRIKAFATGADLPATCTAGDDAFAHTTTGQFCLCNELGDGWLCYDTPASALEAGSVGPTELEDTAVAPGACGDATNVCQSTYDQDGRATLATNVPITVGTAQITNGTIVAEDLATTGVGAATYGSGLLIPAITINAQGQATAASTNPIDASYMRTLCAVGFDGGTNDSASGSGAFINHTLQCVIPAAKLTTGSTLEICGGFQLVTGSAPPIWRVRWMANGVILQRHFGGSTPGVSSNLRNIGTCLKSVVGEAPGTTADIYSYIDTNQFDVANNSSGNIVQPVDVDTSGTVTINLATQWDSAGTGTNTAQNVWLIVRAAGLVP